MPDTTSPSINADAAWQAVLERDRRADGRFVYAVSSTRIFCRPSCPSRRPLRERVSFFRSPADAAKAGFRPCKRCKPADKAGQNGATTAQLVDEYLRTHDSAVSVAQVARGVGVPAAKLGKAFRTETGLSLREFLQARRSDRWRQELRRNDSISRSVYEAGFESPSRAYEQADARLGMTPSDYQQGGKGVQTMVAFATTTLGQVAIALTERGIAAVRLGSSREALATELEQEFPHARREPAAPAEQAMVSEVVRRVEGQAPSTELPLDLRASAFRLKVWEELRKIPRGQTRTYAEVARAIGKPRAVRAVASACASNPAAVVVPCHRVVRTDGKTGGYRWGAERKERLLASERARAS